MAAAPRKPETSLFHGCLICYMKRKGHVRSIAKLDGLLQSLDQPLVILVRADPEPNDLITFDGA